MPTIPFTWADVVTAVDSFLGSALVIGALTAVLALMFVPRFLRGIRSILARR